MGENMETKEIRKKLRRQKIREIEEFLEELRKKYNLEDEEPMDQDRKKQLDKLMKEMPLEWRYYWCDPKSICACMGCANRSGGIHWKHKYTREEWEEWVKENPDPRKDESPK
jgi:hypothetical protein